MEREQEWEQPRTTVKARKVTNDSVLVGDTNPFSALQIDEADEGSREVVIFGSSNVRRLNKIVLRKKQRCSKTKIVSVSGAKTADLKGKVSKMVKGANTKVFLHVGTNDSEAGNGVYY